MCVKYQDTIKGLEIKTLTGDRRILKVGSGWWGSYMCDKRLLPRHQKPISLKLLADFQGNWIYSKKYIIWLKKRTKPGSNKIRILLQTKCSSSDFEKQPSYCALSGTAATVTWAPRIFRLPCEEGLDKF